MKWFVDGDQVCITLDDFINLQESPAVFVPRNSDTGKHLEGGGLFCELPLGDLMTIREQLDGDVPIFDDRKPAMNEVMGKLLSGGG